MEIITLGSSSKGNGYVIDRTLVIEAGVPIKELKKTLNFNLSGIQAVLISHSHGDHSKYASEYLKAGIDCYMSKHTKSELNLQNFSATTSCGFSDIKNTYVYILRDTELYSSYPYCSLREGFYALRLRVLPPARQSQYACMRAMGSSID